MPCPRWGLYQAFMTPSSWLKIKLDDWIGCLRVDYFNCTIVQNTFTCTSHHENIPPLFQLSTQAGFLWIGLVCELSVISVMLYENASKEHFPEKYIFHIINRQVFAGYFCCVLINMNSQHLPFFCLLFLFAWITYCYVKHTMDNLIGFDQSTF